MSNSAFSRPFVARKHRVFCWLAGATCLFFSAGSVGLALTPESPEVKKVTAKGIQFLEATDYAEFARHPGCKALVGMCMLKHYGKQGKTHPKVVDAVASIRAALQSKSIPSTEQIYNVGICLIFLLDLEIEGEATGEYQQDMKQLLDILLAAQKPHGGFGYPGKPTGDTSMTQYGALGMWACQIAGMTVPIDNWERLANWLLRTQDPSGGYGYQGNDPGSFNLVAQTEVRGSLSAAGLGSVYICADSLRLLAADTESDSSAPSALKKVVKPVESLTKNVDPRITTEALKRGQNWFGTHYTSGYKIEPVHWTTYYMYAFERYKSFQSAVQPKATEDTRWYDDGYNFLAGKQEANGSWVFPGEQYTVANTAFGLLFLYRSTQKIIQTVKSYGGGLLVGGRGLPTNAADLQMGKDGLRAKALKGPAMDLLAKLADPNDPKFEEAVRGMEEQSLVEEGDQLTDVQKRLRAMAAGKSPEARAAGLRLLGRTRNLDHVPLLIEALRNDDALVVVAATEALQFMARKFRPAGEFGVDEEARKRASAYWKSWYRGVRPDAEFDDD